MVVLGVNNVSVVVKKKKVVKETQEREVSLCKKSKDFPGGPLVKNLPANARDMV